MNNFSVEELNDLYYALGTAANHTQFGTEMKERLEKLQDKVWDMLVANYKEDEGPEYDGAGFRHEDNFGGHTEIEHSNSHWNSHYVTNEEADEDASYNYRVKGEIPESDYFAAMVQDEQRYEDSLSVDVEKAERGLITQRLLDYVDEKGAVSYGELHDYYKRITGSNSFSHVLANLRIPYKNRKTQRYLAKEGKRYSDAKYVVKVANPSNWVVVND